ncbi:hypothetical protein TH61_13860 [Rufibacter sp. DG15C]|uniref:hypothetical protein n=1 Tax=Rufibacter sp. DG15C TaxID=1379909 RepID=UPI00078BDE2B|nr:hypothetical protein [Rufibacter sp. DG15C]AMM52053.1 hypothetical protein TH61_13860 [Rufibacter sp. DG15C]
MANELNKNRDDRKDKLGNPSSENKGDAMKNRVVSPDASADERHTKDMPGVPNQDSGSRGAKSVEDGGQSSGSSAGGH